MSSLRQRKHRNRLAFECTQQRLVLATVTNATDMVNGDVSSLVNLMADDGGDGISLREAILATNGSSPAVPITFDPLLDGATIELDDALGEIVIDGDRTIDADSLPAGITIDATHGPDDLPATADGYRLFRVESGAVHFRGLTLTGGDLASETFQEGGGAVFSNDDVAFSNVTIADNSLTGGEGNGGGVSADRVSMTDCIVAGNTTTRSGGGIHARFGAEITNSVITKNVASGDGGGVLADATITGSIISDNMSNQGGGVNGTTTLIDSVVTGNRTTGEFPDVLYGPTGGGIWAFGSVTAIRSTISGNTSAGDGGGIGVNYYGGVYLYDSVVSGNSSDGDGGGVYGGGGVTVERSIVSNNSSDGWGGGIAADVSVTVTDSTISGNTKGSGVSVFYFLRLMNSTVSGNSGGAGGANYVTIMNSTITGNTSDSTIGGLSGFVIEMRDSIVTGNMGAGMSADIYFSDYAEIEYSIIGHNTGTDLPEAPLGSPDANGNLIGGPMHGAIDAMLGPLANNGGPTLTHALLPDSPAIDAGDLMAMAGIDDVAEFDQRG